MAFNKSAKSAAAPVVTSSFEKASAFINVYLPSKTNPSGRTKIGAIPLRESKPFEAALMQRLSGDTEGLKAMASAIILDFQTVNTEPVAADSLGF